MKFIVPVLFLLFAPLWTAACPPGTVADEARRADVFARFLRAVNGAKAKTRSPLRGIGDRKKGFSKIDTADFFPEGVMREIYDLLPAASTVILASRGKEFYPGEVLWDGRGKPSVTALTATQLEPFLAYLQWLLEQVNRSLPDDEKVEIFSADLRVSAAGGKKVVFPMWHQDGDYVSAAVGLLGEGSEYLSDQHAIEEDEEQLEPIFGHRTDFEKSARGHTLVFSCVDRMENRFCPTLHRSPSHDGDRMFLIVRFQRKSFK